MTLYFLMIKDEKKGCETVSSSPLLGLLGHERSKWRLGDKVKGSWVFKSFQPEILWDWGKKGECGLCGLVGETLPIFLRWEGGLAKAGKPCLVSVFSFSLTFEHLDNSLRPTHSLPYFSLGLYYVDINTSHNFLAPMSNSWSFHPWWPHNSWFKSSLMI